MMLYGLGGSNEKGNRVVQGKKEERFYSHRLNGPENRSVADDKSQGYTSFSSLDKSQIIMILLKEWADGVEFNQFECFISYYKIKFTLHIPKINLRPTLLKIDSLTNKGQ